MTCFFMVLFPKGSSCFFKSLIRVHCPAASSLINYSSGATSLSLLPIFLTSLHTSGNPVASRIAEKRYIRLNGIQANNEKPAIGAMDEPISPEVVNAPIAAPLRRFDASPAIAYSLIGSTGWR
jgi:hypothetical protein